MKLCDINPHIRYAKRADFAPYDGTISTYDCRLFYFIGGPHFITIESNQYVAQPNTLMLWQPGTRYAFDKTSKNSDIISLNFDYTQNHNHITKSMSPVYIEHFKPKRILEQLHFEDCPVLNQPLILSDAQFVLQDLKRITKEYQAKRLFYQEKTSGRLKNILTDIVFNYSFSSVQTINKLNTILEYIQNHYQEKLTNQMLGNLVGYHPHHLNRLMLSYTGTTLRQHLLNIRLDTAKHLLVDSEKSLSDITEECGFETISYFSNFFKYKTGYTPMQFRKRKRKNILL